MVCKLVVTVIYARILFWLPMLMQSLYFQNKFCCKIKIINIVGIDHPPSILLALVFEGKGMRERIAMNLYY